MKILKIVLFIVLGLVAIFLVLGLILPKEFSMSRSIVINAPKEVVMEQLTSLKNREGWSPWKDGDPNMKITFEGTDGQVGSISKWEGNKEVGKGKQEITAISENKVDTKVTFIEPWESEMMSSLTVEPQGDAQKVTWSFSGTNPYPWNVMCLFMDMDSMMGKEFDKGLGRLKNISEQKSQ